MRLGKQLANGEILGSFSNLQFQEVTKVSKKSNTIRNTRWLAIFVSAIMVFTLFTNTGSMFVYAAKADTGNSTVTNLDITSVEVLEHGAEQSVYRDAVYRGNANNGESPDKWYTTYREINLRDPRVFNLKYVVDENTVGNAPGTYLNGVSLQYGGYDLSKWGNGNDLKGTTPILLLKDKSIIDNNDGTFTVNLSLETKSPWPVPTNAAVKNADNNIPYDGYYSGRQFDFGSGQSADNRNWWQAGPAGKGCGTYALTAVVNGTAVASTNMHIGPYDEMHSWTEINQYAQSLIKAIKGSEISLSTLAERPVGTMASGYIALDAKGNPVAGTKVQNVYVEVSILGYGLLDNSKAENSSFNNYSRFNPIWNIVVAKDAETVDTYLTKTKVQMNENPQQLIDKYKDANEDEIDMVSVFYQNNVHPDEVSGTDVMIKMINDLVSGGKAGKHLDYRTWTNADMQYRYRDPAASFASGYTHHVIGDYDANSKFWTTSNRTSKYIDTKEALDKFIFVSTLCNNPDGKAGMRRVNRYGFDLNRDCVFSTMPETIAITKDIMKWDPLVMNEWHGYVKQMLIEPCTAPHDPAYDYDLLQNNMLNLSYAAGLAVTASSGISNFHIPWDQEDGGDWDDGGTIYAPMFAELLGTFGFTVEFPYANSDSFDANSAVNYGMLDELMHGTTEFYAGNRLNGKLLDVAGNEYASHEEDIISTSMRKNTILSKLYTKLRGINNEDVKSKVDKYFIDKKIVAPSTNAEDRVVGRARPVDANGKEMSFFPDYIVVPVDNNNQYNIAEGIKAMNQLIGWGVKINVSTSDITYNGKTIKAGAYVIDMRQSNRNLIFEVMSKGYDATNFSSMYADIYCNLPDVRGFDSVQIYGKNLFDGKLKSQLAAIDKTADISGPIDEYVVFKSQSTDAVRFVNLLLSGKSSGPSYSEKGNVWMLRKSVENVGKASDYIIRTSDLNKISNLADNPNLGLKGCQIEGKYIGSLPDEAVQLVEPVIQLNTLRTALTGGPLWWMLDDYLGFGSMVDYNGSETLRSGANVVIANGSDTLNPTILQGVKKDKLGLILIRSAAALNSNNFGITAAPTAESLNDIAVNGTYNDDDSLFTENYEKTGTYYARGSGFTSIPAGSKVLFQSSANPASVFIGGFQATGGNKTVFADKTMIFSTILNGGGIQGKPVQAVVFGQRLDYRPHYQKLLPMLATAIYAGAAGILDDMNDPLISDFDQEGTDFTVTANEPTSGYVESGVADMSVYLIKDGKEVLVSKSSSNKTTFKTSDTVKQVFRVEATDYAGNTSEKTLTIKPSVTPGGTPSYDVCTEHKFKETITPATTEADGKIAKVCTICGTVGETTVIPKIGTVELKNAKLVYTGSKVKPAFNIADVKGKALVENTDYTVALSGDSIKTGMYTATVTFKGYYAGTKAMHYYVVPKAPAKVYAKLYGYNDVVVKWTKVTGADGYYVYYRKAADTSYKLLKITDNLSASRADLSSGTKYFFKVAPYKLINEKKYKGAEKEASVYTLKKLGMPEVTKSTSGKVKVSWENINGETGYQISQSAKKGTTQIVVTFKTTSGSEKVLAVPSGNKYYYKVRAYKVVDGAMIYAPWSKTRAF